MNNIAWSLGWRHFLWPLFSLFNRFSRSKKWSLSLGVWHMLFFIQLFVQGFSEGDTNTPYSAYSPYSSLRYIGFGSKLPHKKWGPVFSVVLGKCIFLWCICFHAWYSGIKYIDYTWYQYFYVFFTINGFNMDFHLKNTYLPGWFVFIRTKEYSPRYFFLITSRWHLFPKFGRYRLRPSIQSLYNRFFWWDASS